MNSIKLASIALRNLFRNSRRTLITILVSSAGFAALAIVAGYMDFTFYGLKEMTICRGFTSSGGTGHIQIVKREALQKEERYPLEYGIADNEKIQALIASNKSIKATIPRIEFNGLISNGEKSISFLGMGIDPEKESELMHYWNALDKMSSKTKMDDSSYKKLELTGQNGVLLGEGMAKSLNAETGSSLMLMGTTVDGAVNVVDVTVAGVVKSTMKSIDRYYLVTNIPTAQSLMQTDRVSKIVVVLDKTDNTESITPLVSAAINGSGKPALFTAIPWDQLAEYYHSIRDAYRIIFSFTGIIVVVIVFLSCTNTMLMSTMERVREIGTLKAIGIANPWISLMFLFEGFFIGLMSLIGGMALKIIFSFIINNSGFRMPPPPGMSSTYLLKIYPATEFLPWIALLVMFSTTFSGLLTLLKIRKISIVNSLTHV
ncbi:MAG: ABC transporter permease [Chlorobiaceae bacterium]|nr:ABC transporter permease [Chlorobiaceae bacterium]